MDKISYALGLGIGQQLKDMGVNNLIIDDFAQAVNDAMGDKSQMDANEVQTIMRHFFIEQEKKQRAIVAERWEGNKIEGEQFLTENKIKEGIISTHSGLQYVVLRNGEGKKPRTTDTILCHYEGRLLDGTIFDSSYERNKPATFGLNQLIAGWKEGLQLMEEGAKYRFFIPYQLGYGERGAGTQIPPYSTLIFDVELLEVK